MKNQKKNWLLEAQGKVLKVVAPLLSFLPQQLQESKQRLRYRVVFMQRDMGEILHSQEAMLERLEKGHGASQDVSKAYTQQVIHAVKWCNHHQLPSVFVNYNQLISDTDQALKSLNTIFTFSDQELTVMKSIVDPSLYRSIS